MENHQSNTVVGPIDKLTGNELTGNELTGNELCLCLVVCGNDWHAPNDLVT